MNVGFLLGNIFRRSCQQEKRMSTFTVTGKAVDGSPPGGAALGFWTPDGVLALCLHARPTRAIPVRGMDTWPCAAYKEPYLEIYPPRDACFVMDVLSSAQNDRTWSRVPR